MCGGCMNLQRALVRQRHRRKPNLLSPLELVHPSSCLGYWWSNFSRLWTWTKYVLGIPSSVSLGLHKNTTTCFPKLLVCWLQTLDFRATITSITCLPCCIVFFKSLYIVIVLCPWGKIDFRTQRVYTISYMNFDYATQGDFMMSILLKYSFSFWAYWSL